MTLPMASCLVERGPTRMPQRRERHGPSHATVGWVAVVVVRVCPGLYPARLGTLCLMGHRHGAVLGGTYPHPDLDRHAPGVPLAGAGTLFCVWRLGSRGGGAPDAPADRAGATGPMGAPSPGRHR